LERAPHVHARKIVISAVVIDNLQAQAVGFNMFLAQNPEQVAILLHVHCFAHLLNLVMSSSRNADALSHIVARLFLLYVILR
jgi:hypothetical protein